MITLGYNKIDTFVEQQEKLGNDVWVEGWDLMFFSPQPKAVYVGVSREGTKVVSGAFRNGQWGFQTRISPDSNGKWTVPSRNVKHIRRARAR